MKTNAGPVDTAPGPEREATRHLGLDFGATNIKWSVVEASSAGWRVLGQGALATDAVAGPEAVVDRIVATARAAVEAWPGIRTVGIGVPGLYDPATGATRKLINTPGDWDGRPVGPPVEAALGLPAALINDARAFGLAELRLGAGRGAGSMIGLTLGTGVGGSSRSAARSSSITMALPARSAIRRSTRTGPNAAAAIVAAWRLTPGPQTSRPRAEPPRPRKRSAPPRPATFERVRACARSAACSASGSRAR